MQVCTSENDSVCDLHCCWLLQAKGSTANCAQPAQLATVRLACTVFRFSDCRWLAAASSAICEQLLVVHARRNCSDANRFAAEVLHYLLLDANSYCRRSTNALHIRN